MSQNIKWSDYLIWLKDLVINYDTSVLKPDTIMPCADDICIDSRIIKKDDLFIPIKGEHFDGHDFIADALNKGAKYFLYEKYYENKLDEYQKSKGICVKDTLLSLQNIASGYKDKINPQYTFALTGSSGKTTTKNMLGLIVQEHFGNKAFVPQGNLNNEIGVPLSLLQLKEHHKAIVLEFGARHVGDISLLTKIAKPNIVACINAQTAHIEEFGSMENILIGKTEIFRYSPQDATVVAFYDDQRILEQAQKTGKPIITFGFDVKANISIKEQTVLPDGSLKITFNIFDNKLDITFEHYNESYAINAAAAIAMASAAKITSESIQKGLAKFKAEKGRYNIIHSNALIIIDDAYNANPQSMKNSLISCAKMWPEHKKILVLGDMLELGSIATSAHYEIGSFCYEKLNPLLLVCVGPLSKHMVQGAQQSGMNKNNIIHFDTVEDLIKEKSFSHMLLELKQQKNNKTVIFVKASRKIGLDKFVNYLDTLK